MELQIIQNRIFEIRGQRVMLDFHLAELYAVENRTLKQTVKRNIKRFPDDFMFDLTKREWEEVITNCDNIPSTAKFSPAMPFAFTEQGVAMLSGVLRSDTAIGVNIAIMRAFVAVRKHLTDHKDLQLKIEALEASTDQKFRDVYEALDYMITPQSERVLIGFKQNEK